MAKTTKTKNPALSAPVLAIPKIRKLTEEEKYILLKAIDRVRTAKIELLRPPRPPHESPKQSSSQATEFHKVQRRQLAITTALRNKLTAAIKDGRI